MTKHSKLICSILVLAGILGAAESRSQNATAGGLYILSPAFPKYVTCDLEFRDPTGEKWPNFFYGKPGAPGSLKNDAANPFGVFTLVCDNLVQSKGDQSRRVLGELIKPDGLNAATLTIQRMGPASVPAGVKPKDKNTFFASAAGELQVGGKKVPVNGLAEITPYNAGKGDEKNASLRGRISFMVRGASLGLKMELIQVAASFNAYPPEAMTPAKSKK